MEENMKWKENDIVSYGDPDKKGLMSRDGTFTLLDMNSNKFTSLIPSRNNTPHLPIVATFNKDHGASKGVIVINQDRSYSEIPFDGSRYYFIDGFDGGLARVNQIYKGEKKWGLIALVMENGVPKIMGVEKEHLVNIDHFSPNYDNVWNFYDKERKSVPAIIGNVTHDINLDKLRAEIISYSKSNESKIRYEKHDVKVADDMLEEKDKYVSIGKISMKNFKKYEETTQVDLSSRITFVVGKNNSGKSTFLDAVELCTLNMYDLQFTETNFKGEPYFFFDKSRKDDLSVQNLLFWKYKSNTSAKTDNMELSVTSGQWTFTFKMSGSALIREISIQHNNEDTSITFRKGLVYIKMEKLYSIPIETGDKWLTPVAEIDDRYVVEVGDRYWNLTGFDRLLESLWEKVFEDSRFSIDQKQKCKIIRLSIDHALTTNRGVKRIPPFVSVGREKYKDLIDDTNDDRFTQSVKLVSDAIIRYYLANKWDIKYHQFVSNWLKKMDIGEDFVIEQDLTDKSCKFTIIKSDGSQTDLCYMGSGTIHFVGLCLSLLNFIDENAGNRYTSTLLIEEPEQNLHPMFQSHMANFLLSISNLANEICKNRNCDNPNGIKIVVETHSEYIIGRSQVICKACCKRNEPNPYRVYYFPSGSQQSDTKPYDMIYHSNGKFEREFGSGFTDESALLTYQLL